MMPLSLLELDVHRPGKQVARTLSRMCPVILYSGDSIRTTWHLGKRKIFNHLWVFIGSGEGVFSVGGDEFSVKANDFIWIPPDTIHEMSGTSARMHCIWCHIDLLYDDERSRLFRVPPGVCSLEPWSEFIQPAVDDERIDSLAGLVELANPLHVKMLFQELCRTHRLEPDRFLKLAGLALEIMDNILSSSLWKNPVDEKIAKAAMQIRGQLDRNLNVSELARDAGLSVSYLRLLFRKMHGTGPVAFHREARIREACNMMCHEGLNVSEVSNALGFSCVQSFSRAFKAVTGVSPKKYAIRKQDTNRAEKHA